MIAKLQPGQTPNFTALNTVSQPTIIDANGNTVANPNLNYTLYNIQTSF